MTPWRKAEGKLLRSRKWWYLGSQFYLVNILSHFPCLSKNVWAFVFPAKINLLVSSTQHPHSQINLMDGYSKKKRMRNFYQPRIASHTTPWSPLGNVSLLKNCSISLHNFFPFMYIHATIKAHISKVGIVFPFPPYACLALRYISHVFPPRFLCHHHYHFLSKRQRHLSSPSNSSVFSCFQ